MGEAKRRGTFEERLKLAQEREAEQSKTRPRRSYGRKTPMLAAALALLAMGLPRD